MGNESKRSEQWEEIRQGWRVLLGCAIGLGFGASILLYINGVFVSVFEQEFGWTRSQLALINVLTVSTVVPLTPIAGLIVDRWGVRRPAVFGMAMLAMGLDRKSTRLNSSH